MVTPDIMHTEDIARNLPLAHAAGGTPRPAKFNQAIQVFRGISIAIVVLFHYSARMPSEVLFQHGQTISHALSFGWIGVYLFFIISGFSIFGSLMRSQNAGFFFAKRIARVYPPFIVASTLIYLFLQFVHVPSFVNGDWRFNSVHVSFKDYFMTTFLFARDLGFNWVDGVFWTLLVEIKFYFLIAILHALGATRRFDAMALAFGVVLPVLWAVALLANIRIVEIILRVVLLAPYWPFFLFGMALSRARATTFQGAILFIVASASLFLIALEKPSPFEDPIRSVIAFVILALSMVFFALRHDRRRPDLRPRRRLGAIAAAIVAALAFLGNYSYSWYLLHQKIGIAVVYNASGIVAPVFAVLAGVVVTLTLSVVFSKAVEYRFRAPLQAVAAGVISELVTQVGKVLRR